MQAFTRVVLAVAILAIVAAPSAFAQRQLGKKKGPTSKLYLAETKGEGQITNEGRTYSPKQATAFDAPGTVIETKADSHQAFVYSNGTGMFVDAETRIEVDRFVQEPFRPERNQNSNVEPSISQSDVFVSRGMVGLCTGQLVSGSTMTYATPNASVNIRGGKVAMRTDGKSTTIYLLEGDATVRGGTRDTSGALLRPGEQATITPGPVGQPPRVVIGPIDKKVQGDLDDKVASACNAKKSVTFEAIEKKAEEGLEASEIPPPAEDAPAEATGNGTTTASPAPPTETPGTAGADEPEQEIVVRPTTPSAPPTNIVVSPDRVGPGE